jgi:hypothetical protein
MRTHGTPPTSPRPASQAAEPLAPIHLSTSTLTNSSSGAVLSARGSDEFAVTSPVPRPLAPQNAAPTPLLSRVATTLWRRTDAHLVLTLNDEKAIQARWQHLRVTADVHADSPTVHDYLLNRIQTRENKIRQMQNLKVAQKNTYLKINKDIKNSLTAIVGRPVTAKNHVDALMSYSALSILPVVGTYKLSAKGYFCLTVAHYTKTLAITVGVARSSAADKRIWYAQFLERHFVELMEAITFAPPAFAGALSQLAKLAHHPEAVEPLYQSLRSLKDSVGFGIGVSIPIIMGMFALYYPEKRDALANKVMAKIGAINADERHRFSDEDTLAAAGMLNELISDSQLVHTEIEKSHLNASGENFQPSDTLDAQESNIKNDVDKLINEIIKDFNFEAHEENGDNKDYVIKCGFLIVATIFSIAATVANRQDIVGVVQYFLCGLFEYYEGDEKARNPNATKMGMEKYFMSLVSLGPIAVIFLELNNHFNFLSDKNPSMLPYVLSIAATTASNMLLAASISKTLTQAVSWLFDYLAENFEPTQDIHAEAHMSPSESTPLLSDHLPA